MQHWIPIFRGQLVGVVLKGFLVPKDPEQLGLLAPLEMVTAPQGLKVVRSIHAQPV